LQISPAQLRKAANLKERLECGGRPRRGAKRAIGKGITHFRRMRAIQKGRWIVGTGLAVFVGGVD
jgi:hypothetical protein